MSADSFDEVIARVEQMLADPERSDPARLAAADQALPKMREYWNQMVETSRPLLHRGMGEVEFVDFIAMALAAVGMIPNDLAVMVGVALLRSHQIARRRFCGQSPFPRLNGCVLPPHKGESHVYLQDGYPVFDSRPRDGR